MQIENVLYYLAWAGLFFVMMRYGCGAHVMGMATTTEIPMRAPGPCCRLKKTTIRFVA